MYAVWTHVDGSGEATVYVRRLTVAAEVNGQAIYADDRGEVRTLMFLETLCESEAEAYALAVKQMSQVRDRLNACIAHATAKAAAGRVGEAVPA